MRSKIVFLSLSILVGAAAAVMRRRRRLPRRRSRPPIPATRSAATLPP